MRHLIIICLFLTFGCSSSGTKKNTPEQKSVNTEIVKTVAVELSIKGMSCTGCEQTIQSGVAAIAGVKQVKADFKTGKARVEFVPGVADTTAIKTNITSSGYIVAGIKPISTDSIQSKF